MAKPRVLIIDDHRDFLNALGMEFEGEYDLLLEPNARRGFERLTSKEEFDCVIVDLYMPDMTGAELYESVSKFAPARLRRWAFISAGADHPTLAPWLKRTNLPVLGKPMDIAKFRSLVDTFARMGVARGPHELMAPKPKPVSKPELASLDFDDDDEVSTDVIDLAVKQGVPRDVVLELRVRRLHSSHKLLVQNQQVLAEQQGVISEDLAAVKNDVADVKKDIAVLKSSGEKTGKTVEELKTQSIEANASLKTTIKIVGVLVVLCGALWELYKTFAMHK
jgi:CheY-like chemotaxis protein